MIKLGVTPGFMYPDADRTVYGPKNLCYLEKEMAEYLARPEIMPVLIPDLNGDRLRNFLDEIDGLVLQGGMDIAPETYGEKPIEYDRWPGDPYRDAFELKVLDRVMKDEKPVFGICRGCQLINVYFGGTLYQDISRQVPGAIVHRDAGRYDQLNHDIAFTPGSLFERLHADDEVLKVNTIHHQGIKALGRNLTVEAVSDDGKIIEAFTLDKRESGKVLGVQWHPEFFFNSDDRLIDAKKIYDHFLTFFNT